MKLQVALDFFSIEDALCLMQKIHQYVDIAEIGSPLMYADGFHSIEVIKKRYPNTLVLADMKIVDGGYDIAKKAYEKGADICTVVGITNNDTLEMAVKAARECNKFCMADTIGVKNLKQRVHELDAMGFDFILLHTAHDTITAGMEAVAQVGEINKMKQLVKHAKIGISGGINLEVIKKVCLANPDWIVIGSGFTMAENPKEVARLVRLEIDKINDDNKLN